MMAEQTKLISIVEVCTNVATGFIFAMLVWKFVIPLMYPRMVGPLTENFLITLTFTTVSITRGYFWRRFFANGYHRLVATVIRRTVGGDKGKIGGTDDE